MCCRSRRLLPSHNFSCMLPSDFSWLHFFCLQDQLFLYVFVSVLLPLISVLLPTVNAYEAKLLFFVSDKPIYLNVMFNNSLIPFFFSFYALNQNP